jgi:DNA modification methylase
MSLPKPYYQDGAVTLYHGDCREIVPLLGRFDLLLTDPPYGIGEDGGRARTRGSTKTNGPKMGWDNSTPDDSTFAMILAAANGACVWGGNYFTDKLPVSRGWLYWHKFMGGDFSDGELAWTSRDAVLKAKMYCDKGRVREHPTEKPVEVMLWCMEFFPASQTVLDPFAGSGTTGRACKDLGRKCTMIEREERYCEIAARRMGQEVLAL